MYISCAGLPWFLLTHLGAPNLLAKRSYMSVGLLEALVGVEVRNDSTKTVVKFAVNPETFM